MDVVILVYIRLLYYIIFIRIEEKTGIIRVAKELDYEKIKEYTLIVQVSITNSCLSQTHLLIICLSQTLWTKLPVIDCHERLYYISVMKHLIICLSQTLWTKLSDCHETLNYISSTL